MDWPETIFGIAMMVAGAFVLFVAFVLVIVLKILDIVKSPFQK